MSKPRVISASTLIGDQVVNEQGEDLGKVEEVMLDVQSGGIAYAVLSFGGFLGIGDKLFAVPWGALRLESDSHRLVLDQPKEMLENAPGFDKSDWPDMSDPQFGETVFGYYGVTRDLRP